MTTCRMSFPLVDPAEFTGWTRSRELESGVEGSTMPRLSKIAVLVVVALLPTLAGCAQQQAQTTMPSATAPKEPLATPPPPQPAVQEQGPTAHNVEEFADEAALKDVFFEPDRADIVREGAAIMMSRPGGELNSRRRHASSFSRCCASLRSAVSKPSVNSP